MKKELIQGSTTITIALFIGLAFLSVLGIEFSFGCRTNTTNLNKSLIDGSSDIYYNDGRSDISDTEIEDGDPGPKIRTIKSEKNVRNLRISKPSDLSGYSMNPSLVWTGSEFAVAWGNNRCGTSEIYFTRISPTGDKISRNVRISEVPVRSSHPSLVYTGSVFAVAWQGEVDSKDEIYFTRIHSSGVEIGTGDVRITKKALKSPSVILEKSGCPVVINPANPEDPSLVWTGSEFAVAWVDFRHDNYEIYFTRISPKGEKIGSDIRITKNPSDSEYASLVWTGSEFGLTWRDYWDENWYVHFTRISSTGKTIGSTVRVSDEGNESLLPSLVWTGSEFAVAWQSRKDEKDGIYFTRISSVGKRIGSHIKISNEAKRTRRPSLVWTGSEFAVVWEEKKHGNWEIYIAKVSSTGARTGGSIRVTNTATDSETPSLVWTGYEFGVAWEEEMNDNVEIYFARIEP